MGVGLMAHIPDQTIIGGIEHVMQRNGKFHHTQAGTEMTSGFAHGIEQVGPKFLGQDVQFLRIELTQLFRIIYGIKQWGIWL